MWAVMCCKEKGSTKEQRETIEWGGWIINANRLIAMWNELAYFFTIHCPSWLLLNWKLYPKDWACPKERRQQFFWTGPVNTRDERACDHQGQTGVMKWWRFQGCKQVSAHAVQRKRKERRGKKEFLQVQLCGKQIFYLWRICSSFFKSFLEGEFTNLLMKQYFAIETPIALHSKGFLPPLFKTLTGFLLPVLLMEYDLASSSGFLGKPSW